MAVRLIYVICTGTPVAVYAVHVLSILSGHTAAGMDIMHGVGNCRARIILEYKLEFYDRFWRNINLEYSREFYDKILELRIHRHEK